MARFRIVLGTGPAVLQSTMPEHRVRAQTCCPADRSPWAIIVAAVLTLGMLLGSRTRADDACPAPPSAPPVRANDLGTLPVKEITVFKDGHAFVLHEGEMPTDEQGNVVLDYLPAPVIGTFWPYSSDPQATLTSVVAGTTEVQKERTALNLRELLEGNLGAEVLIAESNGTYTATLLAIPTRRPQNPARAAAPPDNVVPQETGDVVLLGTPGGVKVIGLGRIRDVTFLHEPRRTRAVNEYRDLMTLRLDWADNSPRENASVGLVYLQKGIRWIPSYRLTIDGEGNAVVQLQATLLNELTDLEDVTAHLVIGVPTFAFQETIDPISLQRTMAQLSPYFQTNPRSAYAFSNALMTQRARASEHRASNWQARPVQPASAAGLGPELPEARNEDLFLFTVEHVSLKKGERMVLPIKEFQISYEDVYTLNIPFVPPPEVRRSFNNQQQADLARLFAAPKVMHTLRLSNSSPFPLTTGPVMILGNDRLLAQGMMTYTAAGASVDLEVTAAVDVQVRKSDAITEHIGDAVRWESHSYSRIDLAGAISLTNFRDHAVNLEVVRQVLGNGDTADHDGSIHHINVHEEGWYLDHGSMPHWWNWYSWPHWWHHFNGIGRIEWKVTLEPGEQVDLGYTWHYYWR